ncbi:MAG: ThuA domain-containing protein [Aureliella sp.]
MHRISLYFLSAITLLCGLAPVHAEDESQEAANSKTIKVLLVAGGCCHDYATQTKLLKEGIEKQIDAEVTVIFNESKTTNTRFEIYESDDWAKGYDCILHDECSASVTDRPYVDRILAAHRSGVPAVNLHCAMHSYRWGDFRQPVELGADNAGWYEFIGVQSTGHGPQSPIQVEFEEHPITKGMKAWTTTNEELYNNIRVYGGTTALASGVQTQKPRARQLKLDPNAKAKEATAVVAWTNLFGPNKTRVFSTTLGHNNETVGDDRYLKLVSRGILWATGNLK